MYFTKFVETLTECENIIHENELKSMSIHPHELISNKTNVIQEVSGFKEKASAAFEKAIQAFVELLEKFRKAAAELKKRNAKWFSDVRQFDISKANLKDFSYQMFDYKNGMQRVKDTEIPGFNDGVKDDILTNDAQEFKMKYFKDLYISQNGNLEFNDNYFRGSNEKIEIKGNEVYQLFREALNWLEHYEQFVRNIDIEGQNISNIRRNEKKIVTTESTILAESIFKDEYYDILLEDALDPKELAEEQENTENNTTIDSNPKENSDNKEAKSHNDAVQQYWKICSMVVTKKTKATEECYSVYTDFIDKVMGK